MHEYHAVESLVNQIADKAGKSKAHSVKKVKLVLGQLAGFEPSSVRCYFEQLAEGTLLEGAELIIDNVRPELRCQHCGITFKKGDGEYQCPDCGGSELEIKSGRDFYIAEIEIEK